MGDPAGIGPEVCLKARAEEAARACCIPVLYGDTGVDGEIRGDTHEYRKLVRNLALGLKLIQIKDQIRL